MKRPEFTVEYVRKCFEYNAGSGILSWGWRPDRLAFKAIGTNRKGYVHVGLNGKVYPVHRIIWFYVHGEWPNQIDHIDGDPSNNRLTNLRNVCAAQNSKNLGIGRLNTSGVVGVYLNKRNGKWDARIQIDRQSHRLGSYFDKADAAEARKMAEIKFGFHPNHGRRPVSNDVTAAASTGYSVC